MTSKSDLSSNYPQISLPNIMLNLTIHKGRAILFLLAGLVLAGCSGIEKGDPQQPKSATATPPGDRTALDEYVAKPDPNYSFHLVNTIPEADQTTFILEMTSQAWLTTNEVDRPLWKHWVIIVEPATV